MRGHDEVGMRLIHGLPDLAIRVPAHTMYSLDESQVSTKLCDGSKDASDSHPRTWHMSDIATHHQHQQPIA